MQRRAFLQGTLLGASALTLGTSRAAWPQTQTGAADKAAADPAVLKIVRRTIEVNGRTASVFGLQQPNGSRGLTLLAGQAFHVDLRNETDEPTIVHWHGLTPPWYSDGVADASLPLMAAKSDRRFNFPVGAAGTHWMHAHTLQEQTLLAAPLIVRSADDARSDEQEVVILLHDFSFSSPEELLEKLKKGKGSPVAGKAAMAGEAMTPGHAGMEPAAGGAQTHAMQSMDINDIDYDAYLANDRTLDDPEIVAVELGARVRIRVINGATATAFTMDFGDIEGTLIAVDGQDITPVKGRRFPIAQGQRLDVRLQLPREARAFPVLALREGARERTGIILRPPGAVIAKLPGQSAVETPVLDMALEASLKAVTPLKARPVDKTFNMALAGSMETYSWSLDTPDPINISPGDRVEVTMRNTSMMAHPMHLHGHHFQVVAIDGRRISGAMRDTVLIPPQRSVTIAFEANNPGRWAFHCHHLYHMAAGMMTRFAYQDGGKRH